MLSQIMNNCMTLCQIYVSECLYMLPVELVNEPSSLYDLSVFNIMIKYIFMRKISNNQHTKILL